MQTNIKDWAVVDGAYYTGHGSAEVLWLIIAIILCVMPLFIGLRHEQEAYERHKQKR